MRRAPAALRRSGAGFEMGRAGKGWVPGEVTRINHYEKEKGHGGVSFKESTFAVSLARPVRAEPGAGNPIARESPPPSRAYWTKGTRLTISMWFVGWLRAGAWRSFRRPSNARVVEVVERGYNTLRVDCFPSRIREAGGCFEKNWDLNVPPMGRGRIVHLQRRKKSRGLAALCANTACGSAWIRGTNPTCSETIM